MWVYLFVLVRFKQQDILPSTGKIKVKTVNTKEGKKLFYLHSCWTTFGKDFQVSEAETSYREKKIQREENRVSDSFWELIILPGALNKKT